MLKRKKMKWALLALIIFYQVQANKKERWEERFGVYDIPSTSLDLLKEEREARDTESLKNIEEVVSRAVNPQDEKGGEVCLVASSKIKKELKESEARAVVYDDPKEVISSELHKLLEQQYDDPELKSKKISVHLKKVEFREAIELISSLSKVRFIIDADVDGVVKNFSFKDISLAAALSILLNNNNPRLALLKSFGVWRIVRRPVALAFLKVSLDQKHEHETVLETYLMNNARWDDQLKTRLEKLWQGIIGNSPYKSGYYLVFDDYSRKVFFRGVKTYVNDFKRCLHEIDMPFPQVRIEARVIVAQKDFEETLGFQWSGIYDRSGSIKKGFDFAGIGVGAKNNYDPTMPGNLNFSNLLDWSLNFIPSNVKTNIGVKLPFIFGNQSLDTRRLNLLLQAAESKNEIKTVLKPSMLVKNDEIAEILVGSELPQEVRLTETVEGQPTNITTVSYKDIGMKIKVKPLVSPDQKTVFLDIFVENSMVTPALVQPSSTAQQTAFNYYSIKTSRSRNRVLLKSGQTTLISGLITNAKEKSKQGIPILGEIPVLNWFFSWSRKAVSDTQLLIFITPTLI